MRRILLHTCQICTINTTVFYYSLSGDYKCLFHYNYFYEGHCVFEIAERFVAGNINLIPINKTRLRRPVRRPAHHGSFACRATARSVDDDRDPSRESGPAVVDNIALYFPPWIDAFYRFTRPHTVIGTVITFFLAEIHFFLLLCCTHIYHTWIFIILSSRYLKMY